jgi:hypothetical protein
MSALPKIQHTGMPTLAQSFDFSVSPTSSKQSINNLMSPRRNSKLKFLPELRKHYLNKQSSKEKLQLSIHE